MSINRRTVSLQTAIGVLFTAVCVVIGWRQGQSAAQIASIAWLPGLFVVVAFRRPSGRVLALARRWRAAR
jgi:hypothetical protein